jgi:diphthine-ammonia ligase
MTADFAPVSTQAAISWSGGKDSCLALLLAREQGLSVSHFFTSFNEEGSSLAHHLPEHLIAQQVEQLGGHWHGARVAKGQYAAAFAQAVQAFKSQGCTAMIFGDIDLQAHRDWIEARCVELDIHPIFPLWGLTRIEVSAQIQGRGISARIVCVDTRFLDASYCGVEYDAEFIARLPAGVCCCGEAGEFHSFVWDAPGFSRALWLKPADGQLRTVDSRPPMQPTQWVVHIPELQA